MDCELRPLTVMIGANGGGKTSVLEVMSLLAASAQGKLNEALRDLGGITAVLTAGRSQMSFSVSSGASRYDLSISPSGIGYEIDAEGLEGFELPHVNQLVYETALAQAEKRGPAEQFRQRLASSVYYHTLDVRPRSPVRLPQPIRPAGLPGANGEDLFTCLYEMREADPDRFDAIQDALRAAFPGFDKLTLPPVAAGALAMIWRDRNFPNGFYTHQLSEGALRFLWLVTLLRSAALPDVTLLDEPEVSLHPELLAILADLLREASQRSQIIVATHSDRLVRFLNPNEVMVADLTDDGLAKLTWADSLDLDRWLTEYTLDQVWSMGRLGGRA